MSGILSCQRYCIKLLEEQTTPVLSPRNTHPGDCTIALHQDKSRGIPNRGQYNLERAKPSETLPSLQLDHTGVLDHTLSFQEKSEPPS